MADILHKVGIKESQQEVYKYLATINGLSKWWTKEVAGSTTKGNTVRFSFGNCTTHMEVRESVEPNLIKWKCVQGPEEWLNTDVTFELSYNGEETEVLFTHSHWENPTDFMHFCSTKWAIFMLSLKSCIEEGEGRPYPNDIQVTHGKAAGEQSN